MPDVFTKAKRSEVMSRIRSHGNKDTEIALMRLFQRHRITGWRRHQALPGRPDFTFRHERLVVFVDGCFWHGCPKHGRKPTTNRAYWLPKLKGNIRRDMLRSEELKKEGWRVIRLWSHDLRDPATVVSRIFLELTTASKMCKHALHKHEGQKR